MASFIDVFDITLFERLRPNSNHSLDFVELELSSAKPVSTLSVFQL